MLVILTVLFGLLYGAFYYISNYGGNHILDREELIGDTSNNPYEIRNDVYDKLTEMINTESKKDPDFTKDEFRNLATNFIKSRMAVFKYFSHEKNAVNSNAHSLTIMSCFNMYNKDFYEKLFSRHGYKSEIDELIVNTEDRKLADKISNYYHMPHKQLNFRPTNEICNKYLEKVWDYSEFTVFWDYE